jgi:GntR family transcriptional regulator, transcriptional repressor for pyruvate dehydrogenase complex
MASDNFERQDTPLVTNAVAAIRDMIAMPAYAPGTRLPSESELAGRIGISRPVLRQALSILKGEGLIESRRGSGTFTSGKPSSALSFGQPESVADLEDCLRFRMVIESAAAGLAARHATPADLNAIRQPVAAMEHGVGKDQDVLENDLAFHMAVSRATGSRYYVMTLETLMPHILFGLRLGRQLRHVSPDATSKRVAAEHRAVLTAIENGDEARSAEAMREHLAAGIKRIFGNRSW